MQRVRWWILAALLWPAASSLADDVGVPAKLQADLLATVAGFDLSMAARVPGDTVNVLVVVKSSSAESTKVAHELREKLASLKVAGKAIKIEELDADGADQVVAAVKGKKPAIAFFSAGFLPDLDKVATGLDSADVLTASAETGGALKGSCISFELISGKPKLVVNVVQAKRQNVSFQGAILNMAQVVGR